MCTSTHACTLATGEQAGLARTLGLRPSLRPMTDSCPGGSAHLRPPSTFICIPFLPAPFCISRNGSVFHVNGKVIFELSATK